MPVSSPSVCAPMSAKAAFTADSSSRRGKAGTAGGPGPSRSNFTSPSASCCTLTSHPSRSTP
eukprot:5153800-Pyramimonas_sp.AAC.1